MAKVTVTKTWAGISNQAPWRKEPGACIDSVNMNLDIAVGSRTRNGTTLIAQLDGLPVDMSPTATMWTSFQGDLIAISSDGIRAYTPAGVPIQVNNLVPSGAGYSYLSGAVKKDFRVTSAGNTVFVLNRTKVTSTTNSPNYTIEAEKTQFRDLPASATVGVYYRTQLPDGAMPAGVYQYVSENGSQFWRRVAEPNQPNARVVSSTMPHALIKLSNGTYAFGEYDYEDRLSGNDDTNPRMPWFGSTLDDICAHSGRLFFFAQGTITSSSSRDLRNLYIFDINSTAEDTSNPINIDVKANSIGSVLYSASLGSNLFLACQNGQLVFTSGTEQLTSINGFDIQVGNYPTKEVPLAVAGGSVVLVDGYSNLQEFLFDPNAAAVQYAGSMNSQILKVLHNTTPVGVYRYGSTTLIPTVDDKIRYHESIGSIDKVIQSAWGYLDIENSQVLYTYEWQDSIRMVVTNPQGTFLLSYVHKGKPLSSSFGYEPALDFQQTVTGTYDSGTDTTTFPYSLGDANTKVLTSGSQPQELATDVSVAGTVRVEGNYAGSAIVGKKFDSYIEWGKFYPGVSTAKSILSYMTVYFVDTMTFKVQAFKANGLIAKKYTYKTPILGGTKITSSNVETKSKTFMLLVDGATTTIRISNDGISPLIISAIDFDIGFSDNTGVA